MKQCYTTPDFIVRELKEDVVLASPLSDINDSGWNSEWGSELGGNG